MKFFLVFVFLAASFSIAQNTNEKWLTEYELSDSMNTAGYESSIKYFKQLSEASEYAELKEFGISPQRRKLYYLIVDKDKNFEPKKNEKPVVLVQNGIHAGEIEGKDACMLLLREILIEKNRTDLIENVTLLVIPVFNVDGHERKSKFNRINQNGPEEMGWRTTAQNLNLNRDYSKADSPEMRAFLNLFSFWLPDIFVDTHTTDGLDYQYSLTYGIEKHQNARSVIGNWVRAEFNNYFEKALLKKGTLASPYFDYFSRSDPREGLSDWVSPPRFSHGYAAYQNRIGILIETHMLKPYNERVTATKNALEVILEYVNDNFSKVKNLVKNADEEAIENFYVNKKSLPLDFKSTEEFDEYVYNGYGSVKYQSEITGTEITTFSKETFETPVKYYSWKKVVDSVSVPDGYLIPREWSSIIDILELHGVEIEKLKEEKSYSIEKYKFTDVDFADFSYEGRQSVNTDYEIIEDTVKMKSGDYFISTNQRTVPLIVHLLEPKAPDSFLRWGFFNPIFERKEYFEFYSMEPIAKEMMESNPVLRNEFEEKLASDESFRNNPRARLNFFYERSPYFDKNYKVYPVMRVVNEL